MQAHPHLSRRGNVYQWRRRSRRLSTRIVDLKLSLGTTNLDIARILSRRLSAESDIVMEQIVDKRITPQEARDWLAAVVRREREKIEKLKMLRRFDSADPDDDLRHDKAASAVWKHFATSGVNAPLPPDVPDADLLQMHIDLNRAELTSEPRRLSIAREFHEMCGRKDLSAFEFITLMNLLIEGKAAAWSHHDKVFEPVASIAERLSTEAPGFMGSWPEAPMPPATSVSETPAERQYTVSDGNALPDLGIPSAAVRPDETAPDRATETLKDPSIFAVVQRMIAVKRKEKIEEKTLRQYESFASLFVRLAGMSDLRQLQQNHVRLFRADLQALPKSWGKSPSDHEMTRAQIMERSSKLPPDKVGLAVGTINRHLEHLGQIVEWALDEGIAIDPRLKPGKLRLKDTVRDRDKKEAFTEPQLLQLFRSPVWTGSKSVSSQTKAGPTVYRNGIYWCPLIGAYTGARREEIAGLSPADIIEDDGFFCFSIEDSELRRIKNVSSKRLVPIHNRLIELGFIKYVALQRRNGTVDLFPDLLEPASGMRGRKLGRRMRQIVDDTFGEKGAGLSFHSFRHYVQNALEALPDVTDKVVRDIIGHEGKDVHERAYSKRAPTPSLHVAINRLPRVD